MKILDKYLLKSFLFTFATVFVILFFIFVLQVVWLFISELAGKDLDIVMVLKFLMYKMPSVVPLVLPLSVLLSSIMTFGSLAENYEFAAMKSSGISLQRAMRSLTFFILILSFVTFLFANNVIPYAEYKFINFRRNIAQLRPAMAIAEGQFSEVGSYTIKVEKKSGENGKYLSQITIHKKSIIGDGTSTVIKAKKGELISNKNSNILKLVLNDGDYYEDIVPNKFEEQQKLPFAKSEFKRYVLNIDLSKLNNIDADKEQITNTNSMLNVGELRYTLDSLQKNYNKEVLSYTENIYLRMVNNAYVMSIKDRTLQLDSKNILQNFSPENKSQILRLANSSIDATKFSLDNSKFELEEKQKNINQHWIALYDKFVISFSCILMFFIGAPLGAIIRKGGLGLPMVFAVLIFIIFHFINTFGKKVAQEDGIIPFLGSWMSTLVLLPLAITLTSRATKDKGVTISFDWLTDFFKRIFSNKTKDEFTSEPILNESNYDENVIFQSELSKKNDQIEPIKEIDLQTIEKLKRQFQIFSLISLVSNIGLLILAILIGKPENIVMICITILLASLFYFGLFKSQKALNTIGELAKTDLNLNTYIVVLGGFPFYLLFYIFNNDYLKTTIAIINKNT